MLEKFRRKHPPPEGVIRFKGYSINDLYPREVIKWFHTGKNAAAATENAEAEI